MKIKKTTVKQRTGRRRGVAMHLNEFLRTDEPAPAAEPVAAATLNTRLTMSVRPSSTGLPQRSLVTGACRTESATSMMQAAAAARASQRTLAMTASRTTGASTMMQTAASERPPQPSLSTSASHSARVTSMMQVAVDEKVGPLHQQTVAQAQFETMKVQPASNSAACSSIWRRETYTSPAEVYKLDEQDFPTVGGRVRSKKLKQHCKQPSPPGVVCVPEPTTARKSLVTTTSSKTHVKLLTSTSSNLHVKQAKTTSSTQSLSTTAAEKPLGAEPLRDANKPAPAAAAKPQQHSTQRPPTVARNWPVSSFSNTMMHQQKATRWSRPAARLPLKPTEKQAFLTTNASETAVVPITQTAVSAPAVQKAALRKQSVVETLPQAAEATTQRRADGAEKQVIVRTLPQAAIGSTQRSAHLKVVAALVPQAAGLVQRSTAKPVSALAQRHVEAAAGPSPASAAVFDQQAATALAVAATEHAAANPTQLQHVYVLSCARIPPEVLQRYQLHQQHQYIQQHPQHYLVQQEQHLQQQYIKQGQYPQQYQQQYPQQQEQYPLWHLFANANMQSMPSHMMPIVPPGMMIISNRQLVFAVLPTCSYCNVKYMHAIADPPDGECVDELMHTPQGEEDEERKERRKRNRRIKRRLKSQGKAGSTSVNDDGLMQRQQISVDGDGEIAGMHQLAAGIAAVSTLNWNASEFCPQTQLNCNAPEFRPCLLPIISGRDLISQRRRRQRLARSLGARNPADLPLVPPLELTCGGLFGAFIQASQQQRRVLLPTPEMPLNIFYASENVPAQQPRRTPQDQLRQQCSEASQQLFNYRRRQLGDNSNNVTVMDFRLTGLPPDGGTRPLNNIYVVSDNLSFMKATTSPRQQRPHMRSSTSDIRNTIHRRRCCRNSDSL